MGFSRRWVALSVSALFSALVVGSMGCSSVFDLLVSPEVSVGTHDMAFTAVEGGDFPVAQKTTAECTTSNSSTESYTDKDECSVDITSNQDWLKVVPGSVTGQKEISVYVNTTGLKAGSYTGKVHVEYDLVSIDDEEDIAVTLTVTAPAVTEDTSAAAEGTPKKGMAPDVEDSSAMKDVMKSVKATETEATVNPPPEPPVDLKGPDHNDDVFRPEPATE